jgi:alpha-tubulin suppressor-like RCC1 family protein
VAAGYDFSLVLLTDGTVVAWGDKYPTDVASNVAKVPAGLGGVKAVSAGFVHNLVLKSDGTILSWGGNSDGETKVPAGLKATAVAAGGNFSLALKPDGTVVGWGGNESGQATPPSGLANVIAINAGGSHALAIVAQGS